MIDEETVKMSVILGYKAEDKLYLTADNRVSSPEDEFIRDDDNKIVVVNNNVAVSFAGIMEHKYYLKILQKTAMKILE